MFSLIGEAPFPRADTRRFIVRFHDAVRGNAFTLDIERPSPAITKWTAFQRLNKRRGEEEIVSKQVFLENSWPSYSCFSWWWFWREKIVSHLEILTNSIIQAIDQSNSSNRLSTCINMFVLIMKWAYLKVINNLFNRLACGKNLIRFILL